jgi:hypothetical protein
VEQIRENFKEIVFERIERFVPHKILKKIPYPEFYNREVKRLKVKVRRTYNKRKLDEHFQADLKRLSKQLLAEKKGPVLQNRGKCWTSM